MFDAQQHRQAAPHAEQWPSPSTSMICSVAPSTAVSLAQMSKQKRIASANMPDKRPTSSVTAATATRLMAAVVKAI